MILCCGEALIDMLPRVTADGEQAFAPTPGGAVFNTAIALGRLGAPAGFFGGLSDDLFGVLLREALSASKVDHSLSNISGRPTTLAFVQLTAGQATYAFYDENTAGRMLDTAELPELTNTVKALFFGGISLVAEPCAQAYEALMSREAAHRLIMIDPNIRPGFITDEPGYRARLDRMMAMADIVKLSDEDLRWLAGGGQISDLAQGLLERGPGLVIITQGARGATAFSREQTVFVAAEKTDVLDTVGAGDTFDAGVLAALQRVGKLDKPGIRNLSSKTLSDILKLATRTAAITVSRAGANPPWAHEL